VRIEPLPEERWDGELGRLLTLPSGVLNGRLGDNNVFSSLARNEALFRAWMPLVGHLLRRGLLPARDRELLILRTACNCGSSYEWGQHAMVAERAGMPGDEIRRVVEGPDAAGWSAGDAALLRAADELHRDAKITTPTWAALAERYDEASLIEIIMLVGHYHMVAFALNSLEVDLDEWLEPLP
jgi:alkylhydroperoxidase family enzyme